MSECFDERGLSERENTLVLIAVSDVVVALVSVGCSALIATFRKDN